jgi:hypothetical protein
MNINATQIYRNATYMLEGISSDAEDRTPGQLEALTSIIYAAIALETFINELPALAEDMGLGVDSPPWLRTFVSVLDELEQSKASINVKYLLGRFLLTGQSWNKGDALYQSFALLVSLRNEIVHQKPDDYRQGVDKNARALQTTRPILERLRSLNALGKSEPTEVGEGPLSVITNWLDDISTRAMATWACDTALNVMLAVLDAIPEGFLKTITDMVYRSQLVAIRD